MLLTISGSNESSVVCLSVPPFFISTPPLCLTRSLWFFRSISSREWSAMVNTAPALTVTSPWARALPVKVHDTLIVQSPEGGGVQLGLISMVCLIREATLSPPAKMYFRMSWPSTS
ncbi:MAG: hypothetical protein WC715_06255 [Patescibacteria group bacterium]